MNYANKARSVAKKIRQYGVSVTLNRSGEYDFTTDTTTGALTWTARAILQGSLSSAATRSMAAFSDGSLITSQSKELLLAVDDQKDIADSAYRPSQGDTVTVAGQDWKVGAVDTTEPGGVPIMHTVVLQGV